MFCFLPAIFYVAPDTTYIAATEAYEISSPALVKAFALQRIEMLHYGKDGLFRGVAYC